MGYANEKLRIPFIDLCTPPKVAAFPKIVEGVKGLFERSQYILGAEVAEFETAFAKISDCDFGIGVNSGLDALLLSLRALDIGGEDEVITVPNSYIATAAAISLVGARPVFVDVDWDHNMNPDLIEKAITSRTRAIIPVHLTGNPCQMDPINELARRHHLAVIEDAAQAFGATYRDKKVGSLGTAGCFSLHPLKNLHVWGDGGMITTASKGLSEKLSLQRNHGHRNRDEVDFFSYNSRLDTLHAIVGLEYLKLLESTIACRRKNAAFYDERFRKIGDFVKIPIVDRERVGHVYHLYVICAKDRDRLAAYLAKAGIETKIHYPIPIHLQRASAKLGYGRGDFPVTESLSEQMLSLPIRENLREEQLNEICDEIEAFYV